MTTGSDFKAYNEPLKLVLCCDVDPDYPHVPLRDVNTGIIERAPAWMDRKGLNGRMASGEKCLSWKGVEKGIPELIRIVEENGGIKISWFLRSDWMMEKLYGRWAWLVDEYRDTWLKLAKSGHEIGWHPHFQRYDEHTGSWYQELEDEAWIRDCMTIGFENIRKSGFDVRTVKMGWDFHGNFTMNLLNELGLEGDFSANPGMVSHGFKDKSGKHLINVYDWSHTPEHAYFPSKNDYRIPAKKGETSLKIMEMPISVHSSKRTSSAPTAIAKKLVRSLMNKNFARKVPITLNTNEEIFQKAMHEKFSRYSEPLNSYIIIDFHPYDLLEPGILKRIGKNIDTIERISRRAGIGCQFLTAGELMDWLRPHVSVRCGPNEVDGD